ncbi:hypothetical protein FOZG_18215 [Fusarium oxysporum Fo47]|uniref:Uncharacterized protein n=1 Tax=Fusarium oxysporum Fo47 TaxID=660027 RepID=W9J879_FUSOX|nr:hypothetical protein FOZG_18215 [Fusarium oxysporum Fo47]
MSDEAFLPQFESGFLEPGVSFAKLNESDAGVEQGGSPEGKLLKKQFAGSKILFHLLFWGAHLGTFAYGWCVQKSNPQGKTAQSKSNNI